MAGTAARGWMVDGGTQVCVVVVEAVGPPAQPYFRFNALVYTCHSFFPHVNQYNILEFHTGFGLINSNLRKFSPGPDSVRRFASSFLGDSDSHRLTNRFDTGVLKFEQVPGFGLQIAP